MKRALAFVSFALVLFVGGRFALRYFGAEGQTSMATARVSRMLQAASPGGDFPVALAMWKTGIAATAQNQTDEEFNFGVREFEAWMASVGLKASVREFEIVDAALVKEGEGVADGTVRVLVKIDGRRVAMLVRQGDPIVWTS